MEWSARSRQASGAATGAATGAPKGHKLAPSATTPILRACARNFRRISHFLMINYVQLDWTVLGLRRESGGSFPIFALSANKKPMHLHFHHVNIK